MEYLLEHKKIIRSTDFPEVYGFSSAWAKGQAKRNPEFPKPFKVESYDSRGKRCKQALAWDVAEVDAYFSRQKAQGSTP